MQNRGKSLMLLVKGIHFPHFFSSVFHPKYIPTCTGWLIVTVIGHLILRLLDCIRRAQWKNAADSRKPHWRGTIAAHQHGWSILVDKKQTWKINTSKTHNFKKWFHPLLQTILSWTSSKSPLHPKTSFHCFNSRQPVCRLNDFPFRWQFHLSLFLPGCGMRGSLLWWCATTMLTLAGWATRRIPRRWCQKWQQLFAVAKRCTAQGVLFLSRRLMIHGYMLGFVSQNDSLVPLLKTSMMTALRVFYKHLMHFFCLRWECLYLAPGGKSPRSFQVLAEYAAAHDQVSLGLVWMKVFDETKMITWRMFRYIGISMQMANRQAYQRSIKIRLTHVVSNHSRPRPTWHLALRIHMAPLSSMQAKCCGLVLAAVGLCGQKWSRGDES